MSITHIFFASFFSFNYYQKENVSTYFKDCDVMKWFLSYAVFLINVTLLSNVSWVDKTRYEYKQCAREKLLRIDGTIRRALFPPRDPAQDVLCGLIAYEKNKIQMAVYTLTNRTIANALIEALGRGVCVEIIIEGANSCASGAQVSLLVEKGASLFVYEKKNSLMHDKFIIFYKNMRNKSIIWTGSANMSKKAFWSNRENVLVSDDITFIKEYQREYKDIVSYIKNKMAREKCNTIIHQRYALLKRLRTLRFLSRRTLHYYNSFLACFYASLLFMKNQEDVIFDL